MALSITKLCHYAESWVSRFIHYCAQRHYAECRYAERRGAVLMHKRVVWRQPNNIQPNGTHSNVLNCDTQLNQYSALALSVMMLCVTFINIMLNVVMLSIMAPLSLIMAHLHVRILEQKTQKGSKSNNVWSCLEYLRQCDTVWTNPIYVASRNS
jgi:hypothetical protein